MLICYSPIMIIKEENKMAQVDINKLKGNNTELAKSNELNKAEQTEAGQASPSVCG